MPWTQDRWPPRRGDSVDADLIMNEIRAALAERNALVPAGFVPSEFHRYDPLRGVPAGGSPPLQTVANFQYEIQKMLEAEWPLRWWDRNRWDLCNLATLCQDAFGRDTWTCDLTATDEEGHTLNRWAPPRAGLFEELYHAINGLTTVRMLPAYSGTGRTDSVYAVTDRQPSWEANRYGAFTQFDGNDDGQTVGLAFDVGMGGEVFDDGSAWQWVLEARQYRAVFPTSALTGRGVRTAWLEFTLAPPDGSPDFTDTGGIEVRTEDDYLLGSFSTGDSGLMRVECSPASIHTEADTTIFIRSVDSPRNDRSTWEPEGPDYTSTYREGVAVTGPIRLIVEVPHEYEG